MAYDFAWDPAKAAGNIQKHGVPFEHEEHSDTEVREFIVGHSSKNRLLLVCFTERRDGIRIISARPVTRLERQDYENQ